MERGNAKPAEMGFLAGREYPVLWSGESAMMKGGDGGGVRQREKGVNVRQMALSGLV